MVWNLMRLFRSSSRGTRPVIGSKRAVTSERAVAMPFGESRIAGPRLLPSESSAVDAPAAFESLEHRLMMAAQPGNSSMAYDAAGNLHVAYHDSGAKNLKYTRQTPAGAWSTPQTVDATSGDVGMMASIAIDPAGRVGIAYYDAARADLRYAFHDGTAWTTVAVDTKGNVGQNPDLAFDARGVAHISYYKQDTADLKLASLKNLKKNQWKIGVVAKKGDVGQFSSVAVDPATGKPTVAFTDSTGKIAVVGRTAKGFASPVVIDDLPATGTNINIGFGPNGRPAVSYFDPTTGEIKLAEAANAKKKSFVTQQVATVPTGSNASPTLVMDPATKQPQVVFYNAATDGVFIAKKSQGGATIASDLLKPGGGEGFIAAVQPGNGSISFAVVDDSGSSSPVSVDNTESMPLPPTLVAAVATGPTTVVVSWNDASTNETGFLIERSVDGSHFSTLAQVPAGSVSHTDATVTEGASFHYRVSATGADGKAVLGTTMASFSGNASSSRIATANTPPMAPTALVATGVSSSAIELSWTDNSTTETGYMIQRTGASTGIWQVIDTLGAGATSYTDADVTEGSSYTYRVFAILGDRSSLLSNAADASTRPAKPTALAVEQISTAALSISWQNNSSQVSSFVLQRSEDGVTFSTIATLDADQVSYSDGSLNEGTAYYYRVKAVGVVDSAWSATANGTTNPLAPSNLTATAVSSSRIDLAWTDNTIAETGYVVQRSTEGGPFLTIASLSQNATDFSDTGRAEGVSYTYRIRAVIGSIADSAFSANVSTTTLPSAPSGLSVSLTGDGAHVALTWTENATGESGIEVQRQAAAGGDWVTLTTTSPDATTYTDTSAAEGTEYVYRVRAVNTAGTSAFSATDTATTVPAGPTGLVVEAISTTSLSLTWQDNSDGETGYVVERSTDDGDTFSLLATLPAGATSHSDTGLDPATSYVYRVYAVNDGGDSPMSLATAGTTLSAAPTGVSATSVSASQIDVSWNASTGASAYYLERSADGIVWTFLDEAAGASYSDETVTEGREYAYRVYALNDGGQSAASGEASATSRPATPTDLARTATPTAVSLTWTDHSAGETGFEVARSTDDGATWSQIHAPAVNAEAYVDSGTTESTEYVYRVRAVNAGGPGEWSNALAVLTPPAAPTSVAATPVSATEATVTWVDNSAGETGYRIERSSDNGVTFNVFDTVDADIETYSDTGLDAAAAYVYRVVAINAGGETVSSTASVTTATGAPTDVSAAPDSTTAITVSWTAPAGATGFEVERSDDDGLHWSNVATLSDAQTTQFADTGLTEGVGYYYRVRATNGGAASAWAGATATTLPNAPSGLAANSIDATTVSLTWTDNSSHEDGFAIQISTDGGNTFAPVDVVGENEVSHNATVEEGTSPVFRVRAVSNGVFSAWSGPATADTVPAAPSDVVVTPISDTSLRIEWTDGSNHEGGFLIEVSDDGGGTWSTAGTVGANVLTFDDTGLTEGTEYTYRVSATNNEGPSVPSGTSSGITAPAAPTGLSATATGPTTVDLAWTNVSANAVNVIVERRVAGGEWAQVQTLAASADDFSDTGLTAGTAYEYRVMARLASDSAPATDTVATPPAAPTSVLATATGETEVSVTWTSASAGVTGFRVERADEGGGYGTIATLGDSDVEYTDSTAVEGTSYDYRVVAIGAGGETTSSASAVVTPPAAPTGLGFTALSTTQIQVTWTDASHAETGFIVERSTDAGGSWSQIATPAADEENWTDTNAVAGASYQYRVSAVRSGVAGATSGAVSAVSLAAAPTSVEAVVLADDEVAITWTAGAGATGFKVERSDDGGTNWSTIATILDAGTDSYNDTTVTESGAYQYRVRGTNAGGDGPVSNVDAVNTPPVAASGLSADATSATNVDLAWTNPSVSGLADVIVERATGNGSFGTLITLPPGAVDYSDATAQGGRTYRYRVVLDDGTTRSAVSNEAELTTVPEAVANAAGVSNTPLTVDLSWDSSYGVNHYYVLRSLDNVSFTLLNTVSTNSYLDETVSEGRLYYYSIQPVGDAGLGEPETFTVTTLPAAATNLSVTGTSTSSVGLEWTDNSSGETGYRVERSTDEQNWSLLTTTAASASGYTDSTATEGKTYYYRVTPENAAGNGLSAATGAVVTPPAAASDLVATPASATTIDLTWTDNSSGEDEVEVQRFDGATWSPLATLAADADSHTDTVAPGSTYGYRVVMIRSGVASAFSGTASATTVPGQVTGVNTVAGTDSVSVGWTSVSGAAGYRVLRSDDAGQNFAQVGPDLGNDATSYDDGSVTEATAYVYRVVAFNGTGAGAASTDTPVVTLPEAPTSVTSTAVGATSLTLNWTDHSAGEEGFDVQRSDDDGTTWVDLLDEALLVGTGDTGAKSDTGLTEAKTYVYRVRAFVAGVASAWSNTHAVDTDPLAPSGLSATPASDTSVSLDWTADNAGSEDAYVVYRSTDGETWSDIATLSANVETYTDNSAPESALSYYRVIAEKSGLESLASDTDDVTTPVAVPTGASASATSHTAINVTWTPTSTVATGQRIERSDDGGTTWDEVTTLAGGTDAQYDDTGLSEDTAYRYRVVALVGEAESAPSAATMVTTPLAAPTDLASASPTETSVQLTWTNVSTAAEDIVIERNDGNGWNAIDTISSNLTSYTDTTVDEGETYEYRLHAAKTGNASATTAATSVTVLPAAPTDASATVFSASQIDLAWTDNSDDETGYRIERSVNGEAYSVIATTDADEQSFSDTDTHEGGTFAYLVYALASGGESVKAAASAITAPADPSALSATVVNATQVNLAWTDNSQGETAVTVQRSSDGGTTWSTLDTLSADATAYSDTTAIEATAYLYRIRAGRDSANGGWVDTSATTVPATPTALTATVPAGTPRVNLSWTDASAGETGYEIERSSDGGANWTNVTTTAANADSYADTGVTEGSSYVYRVRAVGAGGDSLWSNAASASTLPATPTGLVASSTSSSVTLDWTDNSAHETGYNVERSIGGVTWTVVETLGADAIAYTDTTVSEAVTYQYRVRAVTDAVQGSPSASTSVSTTLAAPTGLSAAAVSTTQVDLAWTDNSSAESNYKVERSTDGGSTWSVIATVPANSASYSDTTGAAGSTYSYRVRGTKGAITSAYATASPVTTFPSDPTSFTATAASDTQVNLAWTDSSGETSYTVERSNDNGATWSTLTTNVAADTTAYSDTTAVENAAYVYRIQAVNAAGLSNAVTSASVTTLPAGPTSLVAVTEGSDTVTITWQDNSAAESSFLIERRLDGGNWAQVATVGANVTSYTDSTLDESSAYEFRVRATVSGRNSAYSNSALASTLPIAPDSLSVSGTTSTTVSLLWNNPTNAPMIVIERSDDGGDTFDLVGAENQGATTFTDTGLTDGSTYVYRIRAYNGAGGFSDYTNAVIAVAA